MFMGSFPHTNFTLNSVHVPNDRGLCYVICAQDKNRVSAMSAFWTPNKH